MNRRRVPCPRAALAAERQLSVCVQVGDCNVIATTLSKFNFKNGEERFSELRNFRCRQSRTGLSP